jgi:acetolactate synthase-1/2/3 large subunit
MKTKPQNKAEQTPASEKRSVHKRTGAEAVIESLKEEQADLLFGVTGGAIMPVYDALHKDGTLRHVIVGHEQGGTHMAEGYARVTGKPGVVLTTSGPGATNLVTGLADAIMDSIPMIAITGQVATSLIGNDAFQEADVRGITMPVTKHNYLVQSADDLPRVFSESFYLSTAGRPGPILIDIPKDIANTETEAQAPRNIDLEGYKPPYTGHPKQIRNALEVIQNCERPVILAGGGVIHAEASDLLREFAELTGIPVISTLMGLGNFPIDHEQSLGMPGMHGTGYAIMSLYHCDAMICVGTRLDDRITGKLDEFAPWAKLIHIDIDASEIGKNVPAMVPIVGHAKPVLEDLIKGVKTWEGRPDWMPWLRQIEAWREEFPLKYDQDSNTVKPQHVIEEFDDLLDDDAIISTGVGQHQMWTAQYYTFRKPRTWLTSGGLGTMGYGFPAAIGAKFAKSEAPVVCIDGDGSFLMTIQEIATAVRYRVPVVVAVLNNQFLGMVRQWQHLFFDDRFAETQLAPPPFDKVAQAFGALGKRVERPEEVRPAIQWALKEAEAQQLPVILDIMTDVNECVYPMVPAGQANVNFIPGPEKDKS